MDHEDTSLRQSLGDRVREIPYWYHTLELAPGVVTPGHFDLSPVVDELPWPDIQGKRCLDVATFDGFFAFEMERRGASEVVAIDLDDSADLDWLPREVRPGFQRGDEPIGLGFRLAKERLGSEVRRLTCNVYDLDPANLGTFDIVFCGTLFQHLRDPAGALMAMRAVCRGHLLSLEPVDAWRSIVNRGTPIRRLVGTRRTWGMVNVAGHHRLLHMAGFDIERGYRVGVPYGDGYRPRIRSVRDAVRRLGERIAWRILVGDDLRPFSAVLTRPATDLSNVD